MKKILFTTFSAFAFMFLVNSASAWSPFGGDPVCDTACNRVSCGVKEVQDFCKGKCESGKIQNCTGKNPNPKPAKEASSEAKGAFCKVAGGVSQLKELTGKVCN
jgi:hypothetical protein